MNEKNEPVQLTGKVKIDKESEGKKFLKLFFTGSLVDAIKYAFERVVVPNTKDAICKTGTNILHFWVNGDKPMPNQNNGPARISYWSGINGQRSTTVQSQPIVSKPSNVYNIGTLYFDDRGDAEEVLLRLKENLDTYKVASVADLYELSGAKFSFVDYKYGWRNLDNAYVSSTNDGKYIIELPKVIPLE